MYSIFQSMPMGSYALRHVHDVTSIEDAQAHLATMGEIICFERDPDGHDAADAAVLRQGMLEIYTVERNRT